ncbi:MAG TPA: S-formylglutathione hydrolase [Gammaproteobacteria bacterium]|nr:S-formylglutathione hydrolase [Gammaproteobacteria bacterium]
MDIVQSNKSFNGNHQVCSHYSESTQCDMTFSVFVPEHKSSEKLKTLVWLSGLTCSEENFRVKSGVQRIASELKMIIVSPDTSPRGEGVPDNENYALGQGAGFYLDATESPWDKHFNMYTYITKDLIETMGNNFPIDRGKTGIFGHSMGGHGALTIAIKNPELFKSVSAFAPICSPTKVGWGENAFAIYLGDQQLKWLEYDATELILNRGWYSDILIDQGLDDEYLEQYLKPGLLQEACKQKNVPIQLRQHEGYDHSYFFIASFIEDHLRWHDKRL